MRFSGQVMIIFEGNQVWNKDGRLTETLIILTD